MKKYIARKTNFIITHHKRFKNEMYWNLGIQMVQFVYVPGVGQACSI
jgi:hypothetical protein